jgi:hypothetical protein
MELNQMLRTIRERERVPRVKRREPKRLLRSLTRAWKRKVSWRERRARKKKKEVMMEISTSMEMKIQMVNLIDNADLSGFLKIKFYKIGYFALNY